MKIGTRSTALLGTLGLAMATTTVFAASSTTQTFNIGINEVAEIEVSGNPGNLVIGGGSAGQEILTTALDSNTTYSITSNKGTDGKKITAHLNVNENAGSLSIFLNPPAGATLKPPVLLSTTAAEVVTDIDPGASSGLQIIYTFTANAGDGLLPAQTLINTLTLTDN